MEYSMHTFDRVAELLHACGTSAGVLPPTALYNEGWMLRLVIVLMKSDPLDVLNAIILSKATVRKMKQNLVWASVYNLLAIPIAAGVFYRWWGWSLRPEISALLMSASSIIVAVNAVMLRRSGGSMLVAAETGS
jgi:hypothetical protein